MRIFSGILFFIFVIGIFSCKRHVSIYFKRKPIALGTDSTAWMDSAFFESTYILDTLLEARSQRGNFNGNVLCAYKGIIFYNKSFGFTQPGGADSLNQDHVFQLASVSKPFTATAILQLCEKGKLNLNDTLNKFFPDFPYEGITIRMLLCHRSGLPDYIKFTEKYFRSVIPAAITNDSMVKLMYALRPRRLHDPDEIYDYSNTGFALLASIIEKTTGLSYETYLEENIFTPCQMTSTYVRNINTTSKTEKSLNGYEECDEVKDHFQDGIVGDKGIYSTTYDLLRFDQALRKGKLLKQEWLDSAYTKRLPEFTGTNNYGLGWRIKQGPHNEKIIYHSGWWKGFRTLFFRDMTRDLTVIVLDNIRNKQMIFAEDILWIFDEEKEKIFF